MSAPQGSWFSGAIRNNQDDTRAIQVPGCPPDIGKYFPLLVKKTLPTARGIRLLLTRMVKNTAFKMGVYNENYGLWDLYKSPEFDQSHYE